MTMWWWSDDNGDNLMMDDKWNSCDHEWIKPSTESEIYGDNIANNSRIDSQMR